MATLSSAVSDEPLNVLFVLHNKFNLLDLAGPLEAFTYALHDKSDPNSKAFECTLVGGEPQVLTEQGILVGSQITFKEANERLREFSVLVVLGGNTEEILNKLKPEEEEFMKLIKAFTEIQKEDITQERTLFSVCTGSLFLANLNILSGLAATTHSEYITAFERQCSQAAVRNATERTDVMEDVRYVVNNLRFDIGEEGDDNPYVHRSADAGRRSSTGRKGSISLKSSGRRESVIRRASMRLGGLRVITAGGVSAGVDAALYLISALVSEESAEEAARMLQWTWNKGIVVDGLDV
jgi:transcriptional regulator GlxA family with amidase domain